MLFRSRIKCLIVTIIFILAFSTISDAPVSAKLINNEQETGAYKAIQDYYNVDEAEAIKMYEESQKAQEFYKFDSNGSLYFDEEGALSKGVDGAIVEEITDAMTALKVEMGDEKISLASSCKGKTSLESYRAYFNSCDTDKLMIALAGIATLIAITGIIAGIFGMPITGAMYEIAALVIAFGVTVLGIKNKGCGVYMYWSGPHKGIHTQIMCMN